MLTCVLRRVLQTSSGIVMVAATAPAIAPDIMWDLGGGGGPSECQWLLEKREATPQLT
jgi:hypothetical protein